MTRVPMQVDFPTAAWITEWSLIVQRAEDVNRPVHLVANGRRMASLVIPGGATGTFTSTRHHRIAARSRLCVDVDAGSSDFDGQLTITEDA